MEAWLGDLQQLLAHGEAAVLVTVAHTDGSAPREAGTKMLVTRDTARHTIGGGHLEWKAIEIARHLLKDGAQAINPLESKWWLLVFPAAAMSMTLLALNFLGDGLRDAFDPKGGE